MMLVSSVTAVVPSPRIAGMHIVALAAGYIDAPPAQLVMAARKQVLVAVTSNWQVLCLDHNLKLRWETTILVCSNTFTKHWAPSCDLKLPDMHSPFGKLLTWLSAECLFKPAGARVRIQLLYVTVYLLCGDSLLSVQGQRSCSFLSCMPLIRHALCSLILSNRLPSWAARYNTWLLI